VTQANLARVTCGALGANDVDRHVELSGWVHRRRDHGGLIFIDLRDRDGITQIRFDPADAAQFKIAETLRSEFVVRVSGRVAMRPEGTLNPKLATGSIEVPATKLDVLARSETPPFVVSSDDDVDENIRLKYRYLDLRRPRMQNNLTMRHRIIKAMRDYFDAHEFIEVETPILIKSTPEGARDYLVPSRVHAGTFYALPNRRRSSSRS
jgi:aspartyl-tRNA synthetase